MDVTYAPPSGKAYSAGVQPPASMLRAFCPAHGLPRARTAPCADCTAHGDPGGVAWAGEDQADLLSHVPKWFGAAVS